MKTSNIILLLVVLFLTGCNIAKQEQSVSGGATGAFENQYLLDVDNNFGFVYRATYMLATLSFVAEHNISNEGNAKQAIAQINGISSTVSTLTAMAISPCGTPGIPTVYPYLPAYYNDVYLPSPAPAGFVSLGGQSLQGQGGQCPGGTYRTQFEEETSELDPQFFSLASVALSDPEFRKLVDNVVDEKYLAALLNLGQDLGKLALDAHYAFAVGREKDQEWAYIEGFTKDPNLIQKNFPAGTFEEAMQYVPVSTVPPATDTRDPWVYITPMYALFKDVQQACYNIQKQIPSAELENNQCPGAFLPRLDNNGLLILKAEMDPSNKYPVGYAIQWECVSEDGVAVTQTYDCDPTTGAQETLASESAQSSVVAAAASASAATESAASAAQSATAAAAASVADAAVANPAKAPP